MEHHNWLVLSVHQFLEWLLNLFNRIKFNFDNFISSWRCNSSWYLTFKKVARIISEKQSTTSSRHHIFILFYLRNDSEFCTTFLIKFNNKTGLPFRLYKVNKCFRFDPSTGAAFGNVQSLFYTRAIFVFTKNHQGHRLKETEAFWFEKKQP